ncbi:MAG: A/G-specific adenine glycosylase [Clostridia bacterium]|nr:A/G-specific adenine glycosylase [Deltaproteobacteria bacterium]
MARSKPASPVIDTKRIVPMREGLLAFYDMHKRDLPWRRTRDPYKIWISEIMLQQTQVDVVRPRWTAFLQRFPDVDTLAGATEEQVCEAWAGLGYYRRARFLHKAATLLVRDYAGDFPRTATELQKLPGIGRYTSGAIASIAFGEPAPIVDGNVARVLARVFAIEDAFDTSSGAKLTWALAAALADGVRPGDLNQALMELGATVCTPRSPKCLVCPLRQLCDAQKLGLQSELPRATKATVTKVMPIAFAVYRGKDGVYLRQRPLDGLWAGLWEPLSVEGPPAALEVLVGPLGDPVAKVAHQLSHRDVQATIYRVTKLPLELRASLKAWRDPFEAPLSGLARKVLRAEQRA